MNTRFSLSSSPKAPYAVNEPLSSSQHKDSEMQINRKAIAAGIAGLAMFASTAAAFAAPAIATGSVNVRSGPSSQFHRVDTIKRGQQVEVTGCRSGWCYVEKRGSNGWVSANYLKPVTVHSQRKKPSISFSFNFGNVPYVQPHRDRYDDRKGHGRWNDERRHDRDHRDRNYGGDRNNSGVSIRFGN